MPPPPRRGLDSLDPRLPGRSSGFLPLRGRGSARQVPLRELTSWLLLREVQDEENPRVAPKSRPKGDDNWATRLGTHSPPPTVTRKGNTMGRLCAT